MKHPIFALAAVGLTSTANAQPYEITSHTIDGGGGTIAGATYELSGTIGQADAGTMLAGGTYELTGGFWTVTTPGRLCADQNEDGFVTPTDFTAWIANFNANDLRADTNQDGAVSPTDFTAWIAAFNQGANGPVCNP